MPDKTSIDELKTMWDSAASGWAKWEEVFSRHLVDATGLLLDQAGVGPGMRVLDLACGAGSQTLEAARRVGTNGRVVACDISGEMLNYVQENARQARLTNVETLHSAAEELPNAGQNFDASISRLGLMLFASPQDAISAVQRVLKPGARFAALVFTTQENNRFQSQAMAILLRHAGSPSPQPEQPGLFALGGEVVLENLFTESGFVDIDMVKLRALFRLASADEALAFLQQAAGAFRAVIADLSDDAQAAAWAEVRDHLGQFESETGFESEFEYIIGSGALPE